MEELLMCSVCVERYHEKSRHPVLLPRCGHSFCRPCVSMLVSGGCILCPTCRTDQRVECVERLPTEYTLLAIIHAQENSKKETCERHSVKLSFWCRTCEISTCGECLFEDHPTHNHDVIRATKYIEDMKQSAQEVAVKFIQVLDDREQCYYKLIFSSLQKISGAIRNIGVLRKDMDEARELMKGIREDESISAATSLSEAAKFLGLKWNIQDANFHRKVKEESTKDEIDIEKEKAQEAFEKEQKAKEKEAKAAKKLLRKSKTLSAVDTMKEAEKTNGTAETQNEKSKTIPEKTADNSSTTKIVEKKPETTPNVEETKNEINESSEQQKTDEKKVKETVKSEIKQKETTKAEEIKSKEIIKPEEITIQDIIKMKDMLKKTDDTHNADNSKDANNKTSSKGQEISIPKPKLKFPRIKPLSKPVIPTANQTNGPKAPQEPLPVIQEKEPDIPSVASSPEVTKINESEEKLVNGEIKDLSSDDEEEIPATKDHVEGAVASPSPKPEETKAEKPYKDPLEDPADTEGKLIDFIQVPGFMLCVEASDGRLSYIEWGPQGLHVHCLQFTHVTYDIVIRDSVLNFLIPSKAPIVFLELSADQTILGRVYIQLWGHLRRSHNFLSLCLGDRGKSFMNTKFLQVYNVNSPGERILGGDYETNNGRGGRGLLDDLEWNGDYAMPMTAGMITAAGSGQAATNSLFLLCTESDPGRNFSCPFGLICEGLKVAREAVQQTATKQVWITDCGVLIVPPKFESSLL